MKDQVEKASSSQDPVAPSIIVCGVDFSQRSQAVVDVAAALGRRLEATELWLVHVLDPTASSLDAAAHEALNAAAHKRLREEAQRLAERTGVRAQHKVLKGATSDALLRFTEEIQARLLIVASQGHSSSSIIRVGGTSERLAQSTAVPVLVVRDGAPFVAWAQGVRPLRVLLAVDWTRSCDAAIRWVNALRELGPVDVIVGHVYYSDSWPDGVGRYGLPARYSMFERNTEAEPLLVRDLKVRVGNLKGSGEVTFRPKHGLGRLGDHLLELAEEERVDLIVMGTHHRSGLARISSAAAVTLHHSRTSVAVVPMKEDELFAPEEVPCLRRVLVATDLSPLSNFGVPFGYALLGDRGGEVYLLNVRAEERDDLNDLDIAVQLRELVPKRGVGANVSTRTEVVRHSNVPQAICEAAERLGVDVVCIGSHGRSGFKRAVLGSVAETVMRESRRPVFVIRPLRA